VCILIFQVYFYPHELYPIVLNNILIRPQNNLIQLHHNLRVIRSLVSLWAQIEHQLSLSRCFGGGGAQNHTQPKWLYSDRETTPQELPMIEEGE